MLVRQHYLLPEENSNAKSPRAKIIKFESGTVIGRMPKQNDQSSLPPKREIQPEFASDDPIIVQSNQHGVSREEKL